MSQAWVAPLGETPAARTCPKGNTVNNRVERSGTCEARSHASHHGPEGADWVDAIGVSFENDPKSIPKLGLPIRFTRQRHAAVERGPGADPIAHEV